MLQRLNSWGRNSFLGGVLLCALIGAVYISPEVPGKVMAVTGFDLVAGIDHSKVALRPLQ